MIEFVSNWYSLRIYECNNDKVYILKENYCETKIFIGALEMCHTNVYVVYLKLLEYTVRIYSI